MTDRGNEGRRDWRRRESLGSALAQVGVVAVLLVAAVAFFVHRGRVRQQTDAHMKEARSLAQRGNPADLEQALKELDALFALDAEVYDAHTLAADLQTVLWLEHRRPEAEPRAREHLARAEALEAKAGERYGARLVRVRVMVAEGKAAEAATVLEGLRARGAANAKVWLAQARVLQARGDLTGARQAFAKAAEMAWREPRFTTAYGEALLDEGLYAQAAEALGKATTANPDHLEARLTAALARLYQGPEKREEAAKALAAVQAREAELSPALGARAQVVRAELALAGGSPDEAVKAADAALALHPDEPYALFTRARALAAKRAEGARAAFEAAVARRRTAPLLYLDGARALQAAGDGAGALALLDAYEATFREVQVPAGEGKTVGALERDDRYWLARGGVLEAAGRQDEALAAYERALAVKGVGLSRAQYAKGALLLARKDYAGARALLEAVAPDNGSGTLAEAYTAMGEVLFAQGEYAAGCQHHFFGLSRARAQGVPRERLKAQADEVGKRLASAGQPAMAKAWATEIAPVVQ